MQKLAEIWRRSPSAYASRRVSFLLGCDITFDFGKKVDFEFSADNDFLGEDFIDLDGEVEFDSGFRFGLTPYIGLGINF